MSFRDAADRFSAEVERALTRARRAAREARAESAGFRKRTEELSSQAKKGKLRGLRRGQVAPTDAAARADAEKFRTDSGLPTPELPTADELMARLPDREPPRREQENDDFSQDRVLFDLADQPRKSRESRPVESVENDEPEVRGVTEPARTSETEEDFSQRRILMDATVESYRPDEIPVSVYDPDDQDNRR